MTKEELNNLINNLEKGTTRDLKNVGDLIKKYPYFQDLYIIQAIIAFNLNQSDKNEIINEAAIHTADRGNLKNLLEKRVALPVIETPTEEKSVETERIIPHVRSPKPTATASSVEEKEPVSEGSSALFQEVLQNLEKLKSLRKKYEFLEEQEQQNTKSKISGSKSQGKSVAKTKSNKSSEIAKSTKTNKTEKSELEEAKVVEEKDEDPPAVKTEIKISDNDENVQTKKIDLDEQNIIIENFIKKEAEISKKKPLDSVENKTDLSANSTKITDDLISENLAEIMISQGKTDKAVEIYKKLIWKFPQKKSYFASRIEKITHN